MRHAIYFTPGRDAPLTQAAERWLGRSAFPDAGEPQEAAGPHTDFPRRYGFHATIKAPFRLAEGRGEAELQAELGRFCARRAAFPLALKIARIGGFFALV